MGSVGVIQEDRRVKTVRILIIPSLVKAQITSSNEMFDYAFQDI